MLKFSGSSCLIGGPNESWVCVRFRAGNRNLRRCRCADMSHVASRESRRRSEHAVNNSVRQRQKRSRSRGSVHSELSLRNTQSPPVHPSTPRGGGGTGEWCQQTLRQACSQGYPGSARCVQSFDDSLDSASRKTYRISLRSSSLREPRYPLLRVVLLVS